jgi:hypothetical protein
MERGESAKKEQHRIICLWGQEVKGWWSGSSGRMPANKHEALSSNPSVTKKMLNE